MRHQLEQLNYGLENPLLDDSPHSWRVGAGSVNVRVMALVMWTSPQTAWASSNHGGWIPRVSEQKEPSRNCIAFMT